MNTNRQILTGAILLSTGIFFSMAQASETPTPARQAYFGELHLHTAWSLDAYAIGSTFVGPDEAYRFAKGEPVPLPDGGTTRITRPLDFAAVTDHSEWLGETAIIANPDHPRYDHEFAKGARAGNVEFFQEIIAAEISGRRPPSFSGENGEVAEAVARSVWERYKEINDRHYVPGRFTTLHAFEWTAAPDGNNLHRNVIFRGQAPDMPTSWFEDRTVEELWEWMETVGGGPESVLAIPHNANMSGGLMFRPNYSDGREIDVAYARRRAVNEPLFEMMQAKGASESSPAFAPNDEFIEFELMGDINFLGPVDPSRYNWVREALKNGLSLEEKLGANPFSFGLVAATDQHNGLMSDTDEFDFQGSHGVGDASPRARLTDTMEVFDLATLNPGGLTGVWADENTREGIWDALRRKETFGTSGTRMKVHFFGGFDYSRRDAGEELIERGYAKGTPMGGMLVGDGGDAPEFLVIGVKDPDSGNLDRIQIIKGWLDADGETHERIYNVAWSGERKLDDDGGLPPVGDTVNVGQATYTNSIGSPELRGYWRDPDFDPTQPTFYYVRALEIPTPRWSTYDAARTGLPIPEGVAATIQERAWSSPIWYQP